MTSNVPLSWVSLRRLRQRLVTELCRRTFHDTDPGAMPTAMLAGTARSGTTWVAEVIDSQVPCRLMFEPFNPEQVPEFSGFHYFQYMRPEAEDADLLWFCTRLVAGTLRGRWIDGHLARIAPRLRLIKDVRPTLMLRWFHVRFPNVPLLYLLRHPCAVVLSRIRLQWATDKDIQRLLCQPQLVQDYLGPYLDVIERAESEEEKHAVVWCVSNLVPLRQFASGGLTLVHYEALRYRPETEAPRLFTALGFEFDQSVFAALARPSRTTRRFRTTGSNRDESGWKQALTPMQIDRVLGIVRAFGLDHLYGDSTMPLSADPLLTVTRVDPRAV